MAHGGKESAPGALLLQPLGAVKPLENVLLQSIPKVGLNLIIHYNNFNMFQSCAKFCMRNEVRLGVPGNKGTWPKLERNTETSGILRGSGINLRNIPTKLRGTRDFLKGTGEQAEI